MLICDQEVGFVPFLGEWSGSRLCPVFGRMNREQALFRFWASGQEAGYVPFMSGWSEKEACRMGVIRQAHLMNSNLDSPKALKNSAFIWYSRLLTRA